MTFTVTHTTLNARRNYLMMLINSLCYLVMRDLIYHSKFFWCWCTSSLLVGRENWRNIYFRGSRSQFSWDRIFNEIFLNTLVCTKYMKKLMENLQWIGVVTRPNMFGRKFILEDKQVKIVVVYDNPWYSTSAIVIECYVS